MITGLKTYAAHNSIQGTLETMFLLERESFENYYFKNWVLEKFANYVTELDLYKAIHSYILKNFTYRDENEIEVVTSPKRMIETNLGDCDDFSLFIKTVLKVLGIECKYMLVGKTNEDFSHILVVTTKGILIDGTNDKFNFLDETIYTHKAIVDEF